MNLNRAVFITEKSELLEVEDCKTLKGLSAWVIVWDRKTNVALNFLLPVPLHASIIKG